MLSKLKINVLAVTRYLLTLIQRTKCTIEIPKNLSSDITIIHYVS